MYSALAAGRPMRCSVVMSNLPTSISSIQKETIVKHIFRSSVLVGGVVIAAYLACFAPTTTSRVYAQTVVYRYQDGGYYSPYGYGPYGSYGRGYAGSARADSGMFPNHSGTFGRRTYGFSINRTIPFSFNNRFDYGVGPPVRVYERPGYLQPSYGPVYVPFGYSEY
jgi:hypothetical protein